MKILIFLGSSRDSNPPSPARLGQRLAKYCQKLVANLEDSFECEIIDPLDIELPNIFKPHFSYKKSDVPKDLDALAEKIKKADAYIVISPEYNHSISPSLSHLLNHFGSSLFSYKPSLIISYSAGQWGGARAAIALRAYLSELGCLPVSAMIHVAKAQEVFNEDGSTQSGQDAKEWASYFSRGLSQIQWWAAATKEYREKVDPHSMAKAFKRDPSQRDAP